MNFNLKFALIIMLMIGAFSLSGCGDDGGGGLSAGDAETYTLESVIFQMSYVPGGTFPTATNDLGEDQTVSTPYLMADTEVTYELWFAVRTWARANGYTLEVNPGREGNDGTITSGTGAEPTTAKLEPVTTINWREAMVWCNALTEYYNANNGEDTDLDCVYYTDSGYTTPVRAATDLEDISWESGVGLNDGEEDDPYVKSTAKGFRLPTSNEWECAARYKDGTTWTTGGCASGGTVGYMGPEALNYPNFNPFAWYGGSTTYPEGNTTTTKPVGLKTANLLGIRDMSGNVYEWCFDWDSGSEGSYRVMRGVSFDRDADYLLVGELVQGRPDYEWNNVGFRFARTK